MASNTQKSSQRIAKLEAENARLKAQLKKEKVGSSGLQFWRRVLLVIVLGIAGAMLVTGNLLFWTGRTLTDTDRYMAIVGPMVQQPDIQQAVAKKTTDALFSQVDVQSAIQNTLPERAAFLAPQLTSQLKSFTTQRAESIVASDGFESVWIEVNTRAHQRILDFLRNYQGDGSIDVTDIYNGLSQRLADTRLSFLADRQLPEKIGQITLVNAPNLPLAHWVVVNLWWVRYLTTSLFILLTVLAVYLAANRRKMIIRIGLIYSGLMLTLLIAIRVTHQLMLERVAADYQAAASTIWQLVTASLVAQTIALFVVGLVLALVAWLTGPSRQARAVQKQVAIVLSGKLHQALFKQENGVTHFMGRAKRTLEVVIAVGVIGALLFITLTPGNVLLLAIIALLLVGIIEILAAPQ